MPIQLQASVNFVVAPVRLNADQSVDLTLVGRLQYGPTNAGAVDVYRADLHIESSDVATILGAQPKPGLNRLDDLTTAIYEYLVSRGLAPEGQIS